MSIPEPWEALLLALATFRLVRLAGWDTITEDVRESLTGLTDDQHHELVEWVDRVKAAGKDPFSPGMWRDDDTLTELPITERRYKWSVLLHCPWCLSVHVGLMVSVAWWLSPHWTLIACLPLVLSATTGLIARHLDP